ncbi:MFS transporter [Stenotrophomonas geniculata]|uniref:MFS transporter n=1 Tax=Stenotrophomonas TaxID=40323 RepID=UPI003D14B61F
MSASIASNATAEGTPARAHWGGVLAMTLCVFALIASEFMPVSLLTLMAADLRVSEGMAGYGIAISGVFAVLTSLSISRVAARMDRRTLLLSLTSLMAVSGAVVAWANGYAMYMAGRALIGIVIGGFWSMSAATAMRLVPAAQVPRALAIFNGGNALATVIAAPLGSWLGGVIGWRGAFLCLLPIAAVALVWQWLSLPRLPASPVAATDSMLGLLRHRVVLLGMGACGAFFMGQFALFTYIRPFLEAVTHAGSTALPLMLLAIGASGVVGTLVIGVFLARGLYRTLIAIPVLMAAVAVALVPLGAYAWPVVTLLAIWGFLATAAPVGWWSWVARTFTGSAEAGGGLMVAVVQCSIALGSTLGGLLFDSLGYASNFMASAGVLLVAALLAWRTAKRAALLL